MGCEIAYDDFMKLCKDYMRVCEDTFESPITIEQSQVELSKLGDVLKGRRLNTHLLQEFYNLHHGHPKGETSEQYNSDPIKHFITWLYATDITPTNMLWSVQLEPRSPIYSSGCSSNLLEVSLLEESANICKRVLKKAELNYIADCSDYNLAMLVAVELLASLGLRTSEVVTLQACDFCDGFVITGNVVYGERRKLRVPGSIFELQSLLTLRPEGPLFSDDMYQMQASIVEGYIEQCAEQCGIEWRTNLFRRLCITRMMHTKVHWMTLAQRFGWSEKVVREMIEGWRVMSAHPRCTIFVPRMLLDS